jgi:tetratricopeptide (TPR) repeat protein
VKLKKAPDALRWLTTILGRSDADVVSLALLAWQLKSYEAYSFAGRVYDRAAALAETEGLTNATLWCEAAKAWWLADDLDEAIGSARECIRVGRGNDRMRKDVAYAHYVMASILLERGVSDEALINARQAVELNATSGLFFGVLSRVLEKHGRYLEAIDAAKTGIRLTDGKNSSIHFALGAALFELKRWVEAIDAFDIAARLDPTDAAATYNIALCQQNLGRRYDAIHWLEETLRRKPDAQTREQTDRLLKVLR